MTLTKHGHHIAGSPPEAFEPASIERCGGPGTCQPCYQDAIAVMSNRFITTGSGTDYPGLAKSYVRGWIEEDHTAHGIVGGKLEFDVYVVTFSYILGGWKAQVSSTIPDGRYFEVTHNADKNETYVDVYIKKHNFVIKHY